MSVVQNEENKMLTRQELAEPQLVTATSNDASDEDVTHQALPAQNGQGDTLPLSSGILQVQPQALSGLRMHHVHLQS